MTRLARRLGYRDLKLPPPWTADADQDEYWRRRDQWWDNWAHNFGLTLMILLGGFAAACLVAVVAALAG